MVCTEFFFQNFPGGGDIMKELMWMVDIDYVTRNNRSLFCYNC